MKQSHTSPTTIMRHRRIGQKALQANRLAMALNLSKSAKRKHPWRELLIRPRLIAVVCVGIIAVGSLSLLGAQFYAKQVAVNRSAREAENYKNLKAKSVAADACRRMKAEQKASQLGKITYDELYDYGECDK